MTSAPQTTELRADHVIGSVPCPSCAVCGRPGEVLYHDQHDRLFGAAGAWNFKQCSGSDCGLIWLDPMPLADEIGKAYANYYTHQPAGEGRPGFLGGLFKQMERGFLSGKYGYQRRGEGIAIRAIGKILYLLPHRRREAEGQYRFLSAVPQGRLLDVGCGSGEWLVSMRGMGWLVSGTDFDENAVKVARQRGIDVVCGALEQQGFPTDHFDAVTLSHVIEHVPDPVTTLAECFRILKPGGRLVLLTPNSGSLSHKVFKHDWRGLEPPRHLHVFSMDSARRVLARAGFGEIVVRPQIARSVIRDSLRLRRGVKGSVAGPGLSAGAEVYVRALSMLEAFLLKWRPSFSDCVAAIAVKD